MCCAHISVWLNHFDVVVVVFLFFSGNKFSRRWKLLCFGWHQIQKATVNYFLFSPHSNSLRCHCHIDLFSFSIRKDDVNHRNESAKMMAMMKRTSLFPFCPVKSKDVKIIRFHRFKILQQRQWRTLCNVNFWYNFPLIFIWFVPASRSAQSFLRQSKFKLFFRRFFHFSSLVEWQRQRR